MLKRFSATSAAKDNIASAAHCATRLRLAIVDNNKVDVKAIEDTEGVQGVFSNAGQLQIIIGTGTVNKVYDEFIDVSGVSAGSKDDVKAAAAANMPWWKRMVKTLGDVFVPILPAIVAAGLMMGLVEALGKFIPSFAQTDWYGFLDMAANTAFAYLPVLVAVSAAKVFGANEFLGGVMGLMMVHSALTNGWAAADGYNVWYLFGQGIKIGGYTLGQINQLGYQGHVIPVVISIWLMAKIEKKLHSVVPEMIDLFVTPLTTVLSTALLTFMFIGPVFSGLETIVLNAAKVLVANPFGALIMGALYPLIVVMGLHHMYNSIELGMIPHNTWMPIASSANFAQFGAALAVGLKAKNPKTKAIAIPSALSASLGITEPVIFGVNLRFMTPFVFGCAGGAAGAFFGAIFKIEATANGVTGIPGYLIASNWLSYTIMLAVAAGVSFVLTFLFWKEDAEEAEKAIAAAKKAAAPAVTEVPDTVIFTAGESKVLQPVAGKVVPASAIPDPVFAGEGMGPSVGVEPTGEIVYAPFDGSVMMLFPTKHAVGLASADGKFELLIHVGVDTVNMNGEGFEAFVEQGQEVKKGDKLLSFNRAKIADAGHPDTVVVVVTNGAGMEDLKKNI